MASKTCLLRREVNHELEFPGVADGPDGDGGPGGRACGARGGGRAGTDRAERGLDRVHPGPWRKQDLLHGLLAEEAEGDYSQRGEIFALVTNDPAGGIEGEVSVVTGYTYRKDSKVTVRIGGATFDMFTSGDRAWTQGPEEDAPLVQAMVKGADMVVTGVSSRGTQTTDTYSLSGFTATKKLIDGACP
jgi:hypothetical protein